METQTDPIADNWYQHLDKGQRFIVVSVDEDKGLVALQYFDGDLEELDFDEWYELDIEPCEAPENWAGAVDIDELDDYGTEITDTTQDDWEEPAREFGPNHPHIEEEVIRVKD